MLLWWDVGIAISQEVYVKTKWRTNIYWSYIYWISLRSSLFLIGSLFKLLIPWFILKLHIRVKLWFFYHKHQFFGSGFINAGTKSAFKAEYQSGSGIFDDQKLEKLYSWKNLTIFLIKNCNLRILGLHKGGPSNGRSLQPSKENIQHFKTWIFIIFALLNPDPDPLTRLNPDPEHLYGMHV